MQPTQPTPWWKQSPWTLGLCGTMLLANLGLLPFVPDASASLVEWLQFDRQAILHGQIWRLVTGPQGTLIFATLWDPKFDKQADIKAYYSDDINIKVEPEDKPGNFGAFGFSAKINDLGAGSYTNMVGWFLPPNFYDPKRLKIEVIEEYLNIRDHPLEISIDGEPPFLNTGGFPAPLH